MKLVNVTELRNHLPQYLSTVQKGHEILVTSHGQVIARIVPPIDTKLSAQNELRALRKNCDVGDVISPVDDKWDAEK